MKDTVKDQGASPALRGQALRVIGSLGGEIDPLVMDALKEGAAHLKRGALVGLLRSGSIEGIVYAGAELLEDLQSSSSSDRVLAAHVLRDAAIPSFYRQAIQLPGDPAAERSRSLGPGRRGRSRRSDAASTAVAARRRCASRSSVGGRGVGGADFGWRVGRPKSGGGVRAPCRGPALPPFGATHFGLDPRRRSDSKSFPLIGSAELRGTAHRPCLARKL